MKQFARGKSIVPHDYRTDWGRIPPQAQTLAWHRHRCVAVCVSLRRESARAGNNGVRICSDGLTRVGVGYCSVVAVLQPRALDGTTERDRCHRTIARRRVVTEARFDVVAMAVRLRDSISLSCLCHLGSRDAQPPRSCSTSDDGRKCSTRVRCLDVRAPGWNQRRSQRFFRLALVREF